MTNTEQRFNAMEQQIQQPSFLENKGLGNEVGYYIFDYPPQEELYVRERLSQLEGHHNKRFPESPVVVFNLYDLMIQILEERGFLEKTVQMEARNGLSRVTKAITSSLQVTSPRSAIITHIQEQTPERAIVFLTGIGQCYPIIRSHTILNNLHLVLNHVPVVLMYPGRYDGQDLVLFGEIKDDNYYRAFRMGE